MSKLLTVHYQRLQSPLGAWQSKNWDPEVGSTRFDEFCEALAKPLFGKNATEFTLLPGGLSVPITVYNYGKYIKEVWDTAGLWMLMAHCTSSITFQDAQKDPP